MIPQLQREAPVALPDSVPQWSLAARIAFRYAFSYFILYVYPRSVGSLGNHVQYSNPLKDFWHAVVPWVGIHVLHLTGDFTEVANGSGDQLYDYVQIFCLVIAAAVATIVWSLLDRKRPNYSVLYQWMRIFVRIVVAVAMISYGVAKVFRAQFPAPYLARLIEPYGQTQPADLLWTFMGMSRAYSFAGGMGEMAGAVLLLIPQLATLGALVTAGMMTNVLLLNLAYDVPRKIYSIHLVLLCVFIMLPDLRRLLDFFVLNRKVQLTRPVPLFKDKLLNRGVLFLQLAIAVGALAVSAQLYYDAAGRAAEVLPSPVRGVWSVDEVVVDGVIQSPLITDSDRWRRVVLDRPHDMAIQPMDGPLSRYLLKVNATKKSLLLWKPKDPSRKYTLTYDNPQPDRLTLDGELNGHQVSAKLSRTDLSDPVNFALTNRGFHWINQYMHWIDEVTTWR